MRIRFEARKSLNWMGWCRVQNPPGLLKSGIPDSVLMPAPVNTTILLLASSNIFSSSMCACSLIARLLCRIT
jgi:hypothetical protein